MDSLSDCDPIIKMSDLGKNYSLSKNWLGPDAAANPCGLVAKSLFNDTYNLTNLDTGASVTINETNIAWDSDVKYKFKHAYDGLADNETWQDVQWTDVENGKYS